MDLHAGAWTYMVVYGLVGLVAGFVMRWSMWTFGLGQVFYPELYEEVGL